MTIDEAFAFLTEHSLPNTTWIYGSPCRPVESYMRPRTDTQLFHVQPEETGYWTMLASPERLTREECDAIEIHLISSPRSRVGRTMTIDEAFAFLAEHNFPIDSWIYGCPVRQLQVGPPLATLFQVDPRKTGHYTLVVCPYKLRETFQERFDLIQVSSPESRAKK